ncbi:MAG TPA: hemolysin III family protein [Blastocatellia bacterium]|nr:hemolysin III family protein [Blastocatellia bacterium]
MTLTGRDERIAELEEVVNSITHGVGLVLSVVGFTVLVILCVMHGTRWQMVGCSIYGASLVSLYTASTLYHSLKSPRAKRVLKVLDHAAIYLLIAGTYTPFTLISLRGHWGWTLFGLVWGLSLIGVVFKCFYAHRFQIVSTLVYVAMGWLGLFAIKPLLLFVQTGAVLWLLAGGLLYTAGLFFFAQPKLRYAHGIWHVFVLAGSTCHFIAVVLVIRPGS